jgi:hypothetical protein
MTSFLRWPAKVLAYGLFVGFDHSIWILIQLLPGRTLMALARRRPWCSLRLHMASFSQLRWRSRIAWLLRVRCRYAGWCSTCLSRSLSGRVLLDLIGVANELHLGMSRFSDGRKVPHAWLSDPVTYRLFTPGLTPGAGVPLTQF